MSRLVRIEVDTGDLVKQEFTELEQKNLPFAVMRAVNSTADELKNVWAKAMPRVFDRPTPMTQRAIGVKKARYTRGSDGQRVSEAAEVYIRDDAFKGTPPANYLLPQVEGGTRKPKRFEKLLQARGALPAGMFAVPGKGAPLDAYGNITGGVTNQILSQLGAQTDRYQNQTEISVKRRKSRRSNKRGDMFALSRRRGRLPAGVYERFAFGARSIVRSILVFVTGVHYTKRYDIFGMAQRSYSKLLPFFFRRELDKAVQTSKFRGKA
ncbi:hypothetical protein [Lysobacter enzymogenes]|uniref:hypothetical protein n=1 Tax=Lysobacter enzymogenes TaxID=69 RepID=UPI00099C4E60|nr:hypothetical protein [Lysobacter enzymogenes]UZW62757.1 hypothetical protein BV903_010885 [Lysobacter enzymogenes]